MVEDQPIESLGLSGVTYSPGGGSDENNQTLTYTIVSVPESSIGTVRLDDEFGTPVSSSDTLTLSELQGLKFLPAPNANGQTEVRFTVTDSENNSITQTLNIDILAFNDNPNVVPITLPDGFENTPYTFTKSDLLAGVTDPDGDVLTVT